MMELLFPHNDFELEGTFSRNVLRHCRIFLAAAFEGGWVHSSNSDDGFFNPSQRVTASIQNCRPIRRLQMWVKTSCWKVTSLIQKSNNIVASVKLHVTGRSKVSKVQCTFKLSKFSKLASSNNIVSKVQCTWLAQLGVENSAPKPDVTASKRALFAPRLVPFSALNKGKTKYRLMTSCQKVTSLIQSSSILACTLQG